ncbi:cytochrome P450 [Dacryopinax primogenitus]|uniref:Cytochrome P450 n=1 Tax=Dacryopinax primogenitus (strain DJM 731) TaxID=1858805 RepID=M5FY77_DACPD|nr:cytochrome P450 [Dacryopinax primogenitus]EJU00760.1 cytochrome P450 [Dacryopinax primogenitus]
MYVPLSLGSLVLLGIAFAIRAIAAIRTQPSPQLPPGPKGLPLIGNLLQVPSRLVFLKFVEWSKEYGPLASYTVLGQPVVLISSAKAAGDILDRLSSKTSDRPRLIKLAYLTHSMEFAFANRGSFWRTQRRAAHESLNIRAAQKFQPIQEEESRIMVEDLLRHPDIDIAKHIYRHSSSIAWRVLYGHEAIDLRDDKAQVPSENFFEPLFSSAIPGGSIVDIFPFLQPLISRSRFLRRHSEAWYEKANTFFINAHTRPQVPVHLKHIFEVVYGGHASISANSHCGQSPDNDHRGARIPAFEDLEHLPQVEAIVKEILRWRPPTPTGVAHVAEEDIIYNNYLIPKGAVIIPNTWSICRDPSLYRDGDAFDPSRFLDEKGCIRKPPPDSHDDYLVFGHGRRICIGKSLAMNTLLIAVAQLLWAFDFHGVKGEQGNEIVPDPSAFWDNGVTVWPKPHQVRLVPRFPDLFERLKSAAT